MGRYKKSTTRYTLDAGAHVDVWHQLSRDHQNDASLMPADEAVAAGWRAAQQ